METLWLVQKRAPGEYHNSPSIWLNCGLIRDDDPASAIIHACFAVGSSQVRIVPLSENSLVEFIQYG